MNNEHDPRSGETQPSPIRKTQRLARTLADNQHTSTTISLFDFKGWSQWTGQLCDSHSIKVRFVWDYFCGILQTNIIWNSCNYIFNIFIWNKYLQILKCINLKPVSSGLILKYIYLEQVSTGLWWNSMAVYSWILALCNSAIGTIVFVMTNVNIKDDDDQGFLTKIMVFKLVMSRMWFKLDPFGSAVRFKVMKLCTGSV